MYNGVFWLIIAFIIIEFVIERWVSKLNAGWFGKPIPDVLSGVFDADKYAKQQSYSLTNYRFGVLTASFSVVVSLVALFFGLYGWLDTYLRVWIAQEVWLCLAFFGVIMLVNTILDIPFDYYRTFVIEEKFGFNKATKGVFWGDQAKNLLLSAVMGGVLLGLITAVYVACPTYFWLLAWLLISAFSLFMTMFYSEWIVPMFNKQTPLEAGELRDAIEQFAQKAGFELTNIYVIDGSKRSTKANAYFSGLGAKKRIVLYDTLIKELTTQEIVAVLAHEIGHYKHKHTRSMIVVSLLSNLLMFALLGFFVASPQLSAAMGGEQPSFHLGVMAFGILYSPVSTMLGLIINALSRKNEYQADAYAASYGLGEDLIGALKKLSATSLSNLQPHPAFVFVHYSHPTLLQRILAIKEK
ncbi:MAG: M48 family metallopeptidase [Paludibacteraceae bacterium]|nr:M48 family metallopeptidase [Paludibacteraceae bacterium]